MISGQGLPVDEQLQNESMKKRDPAWIWVPSIYFAEGIPFVIANSLSVIFYKRLGLSNTDIAFYTSWLYLPWVIKPLWSPFIELFGTKRSWILAMQLFIGAGFAAVAITVKASASVQFSLMFFWLIAFSSATHDIAADGFYMLALNQNRQAFFVGIRSTSYRLAMITGQGLLVMLAGFLENRLWHSNDAWSITFAAIAVVFLCFAFFHIAFLPKPATDLKASVSAREMAASFLETFKAFFQKPGILLSLTFLMVYRFGEAQLSKMAAPFLLDKRSVGGLELNTESVGFIYGTIGIIGLMAGGILGGFLVSRNGLRKWLWWMFLAINLPHVLYLYLAVSQPTNLFIISTCVAFEQFGYGFGFTAYMIYLLSLAEGKFKTAHYAIGTGFMALSMMLPGMVSGSIEQLLGYKLFFVWILITMLPNIFIVRALRFTDEFGKKGK